MALPLSNKFDVDNSYSYIGRDKSFEGDQFESEIGDVKSDGLFYPQLKIKRWNNEANFSARIKDAGHIEPVIEGDKIVYNTPDYKACFYYLEEGFEFDITQFTKPDSPVVEFTIRHKGLKFLYQDPVRWQQKIDLAVSQGRDIEVPEKTFGSYAIYHESKADHIVGQTNYRIGKAFNIERPWAEDANGWRVWCDLHIDPVSNLMTITLPDDFYNTAVWPVYIDPTFGYTTAATGGNESSINNRGYGHGNTAQQYTASAGDQVTSIHMYTRNLNDTADCGVYDLGTPGSSETGATLLTGNATLTATGGTPIWESVATTINLTAGNGHFLAYATANGIRRYYDLGVLGDSTEDTNPTVGDLQSSWTETGTDDEIVSLYATYTEGAVDINIEVPTDTIALTGQVPIIVATDHKSVEVPTDTLTLTGLAPIEVTTENVYVSVPSVTIPLQGYVPSISVSDNTLIPVADTTITLTSYVPTIEITTIVDLDVEVPTRVIQVIGQVPEIIATQDAYLSIPNGTLTLTGYVPEIIYYNDLFISTPATSISLTGQAPTVVVTEDVLIKPPVGSVTLTGLVPDTVITENEFVEVPVGDITLTGISPTLDTTENVFIPVPVTSIELTSLEPISIVTVDTYIGVPTGSLTLTGSAPELAIDTTINIPTGNVSLTGVAPTAIVSDHIDVSVPTGNIGYNSFAPTYNISTNALINIPTGSLTLTGGEPLIAVNLLVGNIIDENILVRTHRENSTVIYEFDLDTEKMYTYKDINTIEYNF